MKFLHHLSRSLSFTARCLGVAVFCVLAASAKARPVPQNLGNGLDKIIENDLLQQGLIDSPTQPSTTTPKTSRIGVAAKIATSPTNSANAYRAEVARQAKMYDALAIKDAVGAKYLVEIMPDGQMPVSLLQTNLQSNFPALQVTGVDQRYAGHGVIEGYISSSDAIGIAKFFGVSTVILQLKPTHNVGLVTSQGVNQHRVNRINTIYNAASPVNWDGSGMSIGVMSDSFNSQPSSEGEGSFTTAQQDVVSGDLPGGTGASAPGVNTNPNTHAVVVLQDYTPTTGATNEGRGMCQVVADMAPNAQIAFATADLGEVQFANNIRALGGLSGYTFPGQTFAGDVVCDDVSYIDEPMFQDGIIAQGVNDVVAAGVTYCSSAANNWGTDGYDSDFRPVANGTGATAAAGNTALANTNIDLSSVPDASLYAGGFHNFNPSGLDVAQTINTASDAQAAVFQWNDPYDTSTPTLNQPAFYTGSGDVVGASGTGVTFGPFQFMQGQEYVIVETATNQNPGDNFDAIVDIRNSQGKTIVSQDTGTDETVYFFPPATDNYTVYIHPYGTATGGVTVYTMGTFNVAIYTANGTPRITQDFNLLFFDTTGKFIEAEASNNFANNRPIEVWVPDFNANGYSQVQLVISRSNATAPANAANHFKYVMFGNGLTGIGPAEYNSYLTPVTFGHSAAAGANSVAAYSMFRPNLPEDFTSPGPVTIYFDTNNNRLATPQVRLKPDIAAADGANNTFFPLGPVQDVPWDIDTNYANFYGTSCASPSSASVAALVLQSHGGHRSLTPAQVKTILQLNAFPHDLDPYYSSGTATVHDGTVTVTVTSDNDSNTGTGSNNPNAWTVGYSGSGHVTEIDFGSSNTDPHLAGLDGGNPTGGNYVGGTAPGTAKEYSDFLDPTNYNYTPGMVFNSNTFVQGSSDVSITATFANPPPARPTPTPLIGPTPVPVPIPIPMPTPPTVLAFDWQMKLTFPGNNFTAGKTARFDVARYQYQDATSAPGGGDTEPNPVYGQTGQYSADILGSGVLIPEYATNSVVGQGMIFTGTIVDGANSYPFSGRLTNNIGHGYSRLDGYGFVNAEAATAAALPTPGVVSRKVHGSAGTFDIPLPLVGTHGIECRTPGANNSYQLVFTFAAPVQSAGNASVTHGTGAAATPTLGPDPNQVTVNLTGVTNAQHLTVSLGGVLDTSGNVLSSVAAPMDVLLGDVSASGRTDNADAILVRNNSGIIPTDQSSARSDVNCSGRVDNADAIVIRNNSGNALP